MSCEDSFTLRLNGRDQILDLVHVKSWLLQALCHFGLIWSSESRKATTFLTGQICSTNRNHLSFARKLLLRVAPWIETIFVSKTVSMLPITNEKIATESQKQLNLISLCIHKATICAILFGIALPCQQKISAILIVFSAFGSYLKLGFEWSLGCD